MADAFLLRRADGSYRVVEVPSGPAAPHIRGLLADASAQAGDRILARVEVEAPADYLDELHAEAESVRAWAPARDVRALRDHARRVVARWRDRQTGRGV